MAAQPGWLDRAAVTRAWSAYCAHAHDNSFFLWQWISLGLSRMTNEVPCESA